MDDRPLPRWIWASILVGAGFFILALLVSAVFDPAIRVLHTLQALIYIAVIVLARRNSAWGFGAGFTISLLWNYTNLFVTTFIAAVLYFAAIIVTTGPQYVPLLKRVFHIAGLVG